MIDYLKFTSSAVVRQPLSEKVALRSQSLQQRMLGKWILSGIIKWNDEGRISALPHEPLITSCTVSPQVPQSVENHNVR